MKKTADTSQVEERIKAKASAVMNNMIDSQAIIDSYRRRAPQ
ncbi:MAG: hypothetical protein P8P83_05100 [Rickettsiaceae bacterium]|nr:hypothetical protein [Rickettsiaceae bacterium]